MNAEGNLSESNQETADILNIFASVFEIEGNGDLPTFEKRNYNQPLDTTEEPVSKAIGRLNSSKSQGPDNIHPKLLSMYVNVLNMMPRFLLAVLTYCTMCSRNFSFS